LVAAVLRHLPPMIALVARVSRALTVGVASSSQSATLTGSDQ